MTRDEVLAMEPGRALDSLVAEKVMGWTEVYADNGLDDVDAPLYRESVGTAPRVGFYPSTDISAAWEAVEKMRPDLHWFGVDLHGNRYRAIFRTKEDRSNEDWSEAFALTVPEAICKAALLAVINT